MELYIGSGGHVYIYELTASADTLPKRDIEGEAGPGIVSLALDKGRNLYIADELTHLIIVYAPDVDGMVKPIQVIDTFDMGSPRSVALDSGGNLYALRSTSSAAIVAVYPPGANGQNVAPMRTIGGIQVGQRRPQCIAIDSQDYLYLAESPDVGSDASPGSGVVSVYAPGASGVPKPVRRIEGTSTGLMAATAMDFDAADNLYVANGDSVLVFGYEGHGDEAPVRVVAGSETGLAANFALAVDPAGVIYSGTSQPWPPAGAYVSVFAAGANGNVAPIRSITNIYASAGCMAIDKPRTRAVHEAVRGTGDSTTVDPRAHPLSITLAGYFDQPVGNLIVGGSGWIMRPGQPPIPAPPPGGWGPISADTRAALMGLVLDELAKYLPDAATRGTVRAELLDDVQASVNRLRQSVAERPVAHTEAPVMKTRILEALARRFGFRSKPR